MLFLSDHRQWPKKYEVELMLSLIGESFKFVSFIQLLTDSCLQTYRARIICGDYVLESKRHPLWEYDALILEVERLLLMEMK